MSTDRISRHRMFMEIATVVAKRGTCDRARVGAVLVNSDNKIISIGYNGAPSGEAHCDEVGHLIFDGHCVRTIHAEENCLNGVTLKGHNVLYVTHYPCAKCQIYMYEKLRNSPQECSLEVVFGILYGVRTNFESLPGVRSALKFTSLQVKEE